MDSYINQVKEILQTVKVSSKLKFALEDIIFLEENGWGGGVHLYHGNYGVYRKSINQRKNRFMCNGKI